MRNRFVMESHRFHAYKRNYFIFMGWFTCNSMEADADFIPCIDKKKLPYEVKEIPLLFTEVKNVEGQLVSKKYCIIVKLPSSWKHGNNLQLFYKTGEVIQKLYQESVQKLFLDQFKMLGDFESKKVSDKGFNILGHYISGERVEIKVLNEDNSPYSATIDIKTRTDLRNMYPECDDDLLRGYSIKFAGEHGHKARICISSASYYCEYIVKLTDLYIDKAYEMISRNLEKVERYVYGYGLLTTGKKVFSKLAFGTDITYSKWYRKHKVTAKELQLQRNEDFSKMPLISIVVPLYNTPEKYLLSFVKSIQAQSYEHWELCLSDGSGKDSPITELLNKLSGADARIRVVAGDRPLQISDNTNKALEIVKGDFIAFADHDDELAPNALYEVVKAINENPDVDLIYSDEDKVDMAGREHFMPHFKPDFNLDLLRSNNYICHLCVVSKKLQKKVGLLNSEFNGAQDYDFILRCVEAGCVAHHIPKILYHWRAHAESTAENPESKKYAFEAGKKAIEASYLRQGISADVLFTEYDGIYRTRMHCGDEPLVSILIPNKDHINDLKRCIESIEVKSDYRNLEYIIIENNSSELSTFSYYKELEKNDRIHVVYWKEKGFNFSAINNFGFKHAHGEYILLLNNDTEIKNPNSIREMVGYCRRGDVGGVGARLYYEDGTIQHAGVIVGLGGIAGHVFCTLSGRDPGYLGRVIEQQDMSAVTAACMMVPAEVYREVGGLDENFAVAFNDVDFCLRIREKGYLIVYNPYVELLHYESKSRGLEDTPEKQRRFRSECDNFELRWRNFLKKGDPYYNKNLTLTKLDYSLSEK